jgi:hypothetical protein
MDPLLISGLQWDIQKSAIHVKERFLSHLPGGSYNAITFLDNKI